MITSIYRILDADWLWCLVAMVITIESKVTINGKFYATGPIFFFLHTVIILPLVSLVATNAFNDELGVFIPYTRGIHTWCLFIITNLGVNTP